MIQSYATAMYAYKRAGLTAGEKVLVLGAGGGIGLAAVDVAVAYGAEVIAAASTADKLSAAQAAGATSTILYEDEDLKERVREVSGGGVDIVIDPVGGEKSEAALRALGKFGRLCVIGFTSGSIASIPLNQVLLSNRSVIGIDWGAWTGSDPVGNRKLIEEVVADGRTGHASSSRALRTPVGRCTVRDGRNCWSVGLSERWCWCRDGSCAGLAAVRCASPYPTSGDPLPTDDDLPALVDEIVAGVHDPATMPFLKEWTDVPSPLRERESLQWWWRQRADWSPDKWGFSGAVFVDGSPIGVQDIMGANFSALRSFQTGSWIGLRHQGRGIGKEMRAAILHLGFAGLGAVEARQRCVARQCPFARSLESPRLRAKRGRPRLAPGSARAPDQAAAHPCEVGGSET